MRRAWTAALFVAAAACGAKTGLEVDEPQVVDPGLDAARPADAGPRDAAAPRDAFVPDVPPVPIERCALEMPNAELVGSTPLGPVELRYAWVGEQEDCDLAHLHFSAEPRLASVGLSHLPQEPWLRVYSVAWGYPPGAYDVHLTLRVDGEEREAIGVVTIVRHDRPPIRAAGAARTASAAARIPRPRSRRGARSSARSASSRASSGSMRRAGPSEAASGRRTATSSTRSASERLAARPRAPRRTPSSFGAAFAAPRLAPGKVEPPHVPAAG